MATNEFIKTKAIDNAKRNAKKWIGYPPFAFITSGGLATATFLVGEQILEIDDKPAFMAASITGSYGLVGSYNHFNKLDKQSIKAINPENNMLFNETYYKEYKKRKFKNIIASTGLTAATGTLFFLTTFVVTFILDHSVILFIHPTAVEFFVCGMMGRFNNAYSPIFNNWNGNAT